MEGAGALLLGVLALAAVIVLSAAISALAPYLALFLVISALLWALISKDKPPAQKPPTEVVIEPDPPPRE